MVRNTVLLCRLEGQNKGQNQLQNLSSLRRLVVVTFEKYNRKTMQNIRDTKAGLADRRRYAEEFKGQVKGYSTQDI